VSSGAFADALRALTSSLEELGSPSAIIGGVAVIANGVPRSTVDIDATVSAQAVEPERLAAALARHDIVPRIDGAVEFARTRHVFLAEHRPSGVPVDVSLAWLPFEEEAIAAAEPRDFAGVRTRVARPEDLVIYKMVAARPRDLDDVEGLLLVHGRGMDLRRVRAVVADFAAALEDEERPAVLERLLRQTGLG
jgi:Nucleotidyl transferase of unknown function (DUF2204)